MQINLMIVDDHILFREGLASLFHKQDGFKVIAEAGDVAEAIELASKAKPDVILMDFSLPDGTGLDATRSILSQLPGVKIVFLTMHDDDERLFAAIRSGAKGYLLKNVPVTKLITSLQALVTDGEAPISRQMTAHILGEMARSGQASSQVPDPQLNMLTAREKEILIALAKGANNQAIAEQFFISENTVKNHVHNILEKLNLSSRREAAALAQRYGLGNR